MMLGFLKKFKREEKPKEVLYVFESSWAPYVMETAGSKPSPSVPGTFNELAPAQAALEKHLIRLAKSVDGSIYIVRDDGMSGTVMLDSNHLMYVHIRALYS